MLVHAELKLIGYNEAKIDHIEVQRKHNLALEVDHRAAKVNSHVDTSSTQNGRATGLLAMMLAVSTSAR